jgi:hypothetical protein
MAADAADVHRGPPVSRLRHRYGKRDNMYQATVDAASIRIWLRDLVR